MAAVETDTAQSIKHAQRAMMAGRLDEAEAELRTLLASDPDNADALYAAAVCARYRGDASLSSERLQHLKTLQPEFGRAYQEEGHLLRQLGRGEEAIKAYQLATRFNPALIAAWDAQADLLNASGDAAGAGIAHAQSERLKHLPEEVLSVTNLLAEGKLIKAETLCRSFLQRNPQHVEAMRLLAEIGVQLGILDDAEFLLESAISFEPETVQLRLDYIQVLRKRQKFQRALEEAQALYERDPSNPLFISHLAIESMQTGAYERALELFDTILANTPADPLTLTSRGHALKTMGRQEDAIASYRSAITAQPAHGDAWYGLANLKTYRFTDEDSDKMQAAEALPGLAHGDRIHLCFALGKAMEDAERHDAAFAYYERGNRLKQIQTRYTSDQMSAEFDAQARHCTPELLARRAQSGDPSPDPIFIVGLPRAGSTLLEQILASHSQVDGTLELPNILSLAHRLRGRNKLADRERYPRILGELSDDDLAALGRDYIESTRIHRADAPFFIDKMPNNFRHIGLIKLILPNARIIDARRAPLDCCFSGFKQLFAEGQEFTYGLEEIGAYYRDYVALMRHWDSVLPGEILRVQYEDVVQDLETQVRRLLDFCHLDFEQSCIDFHQTRRAVRTASSEQVRRPINTAGLEPWRPYEAHLDPLKAALGPALHDYRD